MAYVITAVGAGGKTTYLTERGRRLAAEGKKVAFTTTTHIWAPKTTDAESGIRYFGTPVPGGKLASPDPDLWRKICAEYDAVLVEGDGSHCMPVKIPGAEEPVIPDNTDEITVVMGKHALGRRLKTVCQRFSGEDCKVTEKTLYDLADRYYVKPLSEKYPGAVVRVVLSDMQVSGLDRDIGKITLVLLASGFGVRFGGNKLTENIGGKKLYERMLEKLCSVSGRLGRDAQVLVVTQYREIMNEVRTKNRNNMSAVLNTQAAEGISASVRIGTSEAVSGGSDAVAFFAADMPFLPEEDILMFLRQFMFSGKTCACMQIREKAPEGGKVLYKNVNPGAFRLKKKTAEQLLALSGDRGAMKIIASMPEECHYYQIEPEKVRDIDRREDIGNL